MAGPLHAAWQRPHKFKTKLSHKRKEIAHSSENLVTNLGTQVIGIMSQKQQPNGYKFPMTRRSNIF